MAFEWTIVDEIRLYRWVAEFKPAGVHKHFHMLCILERMNDPEKYPVILLQKEAVRPAKVFTAKEIWVKLGLAYNLAEVDRIEDRELGQTSGNDGDESRKGLRERMRRLREVRDFELPWDEYGELILENARNGVEEEARDHTDAEKLEESRTPEPHVSEREETGSTGSKRRSTRIRQSRRLKRSRPSSDDDASSKESSDGELHDSASVKPKEGPQEQRKQEGAGEGEDAGSSGDLPLAKRTRHSSQTRTSSEPSPKRKKRAVEQPTAAALPTRVSSRLRNRKQ
ncbi:hypothetical protein HG536_0D02930 [Torulaspora globosa]|uniref:Chromatin modification-related protein EAF7 n=1 Tax=Torulaspora globosa TaxID=48254 RepID=A0A7G3ZGY5_9SACH|nr:uncharacterized protein HG536_0D02930 [Torulaspora globosa]QLL32771.1 hypothetical protein HG536_0D02930 [Torulaspora globosa]